MSSFQTTERGKMQDNGRLTMTIDDLVAYGFGSRNTLYRLARLNQLPVPTISVGKRLYVSKLAVQKLLESMVEIKADEQ